MREDGYWLNLGEGKTEAAERSVPVHECIVPIIERRLKDKDRFLIANLVRGGRDKRRGHHVSKAGASGSMPASKDAGRTCTP